jgi:hypothetical protein
VVRDARARADTRRLRAERGMIVRIPLFVEIPQVIGCFISAIMGRSWAGPRCRWDNPGGTGTPGSGAKAGSASRKFHSGIALRNSGR